MEIRYSREMNHNYMIIEAPEEETGYAVQMLSANAIETHLLPAKPQPLNFPVCGQHLQIPVNGSQTDPIVEKLAMGYPARDAIALPLLAMDYEKDSLDTPRIVAVVGSKCRKGYLGIVRRDALLVREFDLVPGQVRYLSTYEKNRPCDDQVTGDFDGTCAHCAVNYVVDGGIFADFTNPVTSAAAVAEGDGYELAVRVI